MTVTDTRTDPIEDAPTWRAVLVDWLLTAVELAVVVVIVASLAVIAIAAAP